MSQHLKKMRERKQMKLSHKQSLCRYARLHHGAKTLNPRYTRLHHEAKKLNHRYARLHHEAEKLNHRYARLHHGAEKLNHRYARLHHGMKNVRIYITARACTRASTRARPRIEELKTKFLIITIPPWMGGCGGKVGKKFAYFAEDYIAELLDRLNAKYGKRTTHAVCNLLKQGSYEMDGTAFQHRTDEEDAAIVLMSLLDQAVKVPQRYVTKLLYRAHLGELTYVGDQHQRLNDIRRTLADAAWREKLEALHIADGSLLTDARGNICLVEQQRLQGNAPAWNGRAVEDIKPAVLRGEWQIAPEDMAQTMREQLRQSAAEEQRKNEDFWQDVQNLLHPGRASNVQ